MKLWLRWRLPGARNELPGFRWRSNDAWRPKGVRHDQARAIGARDAIAPFPFLQKLEAEKNDRKDRSCIKDPKQSVEELFHPRKPTRT